MVKTILIAVSWFVAGGLAYYAYALYGENTVLQAELNDLDGIEARYQQQVQRNTEQREEFESQIQQLQNNLSGAQAQMTNLSAALQEARLLIAPIVPEAAETQTTPVPDQ